jgi:hypothetical protein
MDNTLAFQKSCTVLSKQSDLKQPILRKPRKQNIYLSSATALKNELVSLDLYIKRISKAYLKIKDSFKSGTFLNLPHAQQIYEFTGIDKDTLDMQISTIFKSLNTRLESIRGQTEFEKSVVAVLEVLLVNAQSQFVQLRQKRKAKQMISKPKMKPKFAVLTHDESDSDSEMPVEERQRLELENRELLEHLDGDLELLRNATQALSDVSEMQNTIALHLAAQNETIQTIHNNVDDSFGKITQGNEYLVSADRIFGGPKVWVLIFFIAASGCLLFLDYFYS